MRPIYEEQLAADGHRQTFSLPGENSCSKWVNQNESREYVNAESGEGRSKRSRNLTPKGLACKCNILWERRSRINGRLIRKYATIEDLLFSTRNVIAVQEEMGQFNDLFQMLLSAHEEYNSLLEDEARVKEDGWFDEIGNQVFSFNRKITCWLKNAEEENKSKSSPRCSRSSASKTKGSKTSKESRSFRGPKSSKEKELEDKIRVAELAAEAELLEQKQIIECEAQKLKIREELANARARVSAHNEVKPVYFEEAITHKEKQFGHDSRYHRRDYESTVQGKEMNCFDTWNSSAVRDHCKEKLKQKSIIKKNVPAVIVDEGVSKIMCQLLKQQSAPDIDVDIFSGNPMDFH